MSGRVTRSQTGKTPRKSMMPDGFVETPGTRRRRPAGATSRKSGGASSDDRSRSPSPTDDDDMSASAELTAPPTTTTTTSSSSSSSSSSSATPTSRTSATPGSSNGSAHNHVNGKMHGTANGQMNGAANGQVDGTSSGKIIDGWLVGSDPKIDHDPHYDFGGTLGVTAMMLGFPLLMWYMWIGATYYDGHFPSEPSMTWTQFGHHLVHLAYTGAFPHAKAWRIYGAFFLFEAVLYLFAPGIYSTGKPLAHAGGRQLQYYCSGVWSFYISIAVALALHYTGLFKLYTLIDEFGPLMSVAICAGFIVAVVAYVSALARGAEHRMTGYHIYDFFMGAELNPRMFGWLDLKMFFEVRLPWYILFFISLSAAFRQIETYGYVSGEVAFLVMAHWLYANACSKGEEMIVTTWDIYYEKWGFMLIFWNSAGVPLSYCHCTIFLANHHPSEYRWSKPVLVFLYLSYLFAYWVWDTGNSQKNMFRADERGVRVDRNTFPQLPWKEVKNPAVIRTESGDSLMVDGWFKYARKINYTADFYFAFCWGLITGFKSPFPWFYPVFFAVMIVHRAYRDIQRCKLKYGAAWEEYERRTSYLFIPYVI